MKNPQSTKRWLWALLFFCQAFLGLSLFLLIPTEQGPNVQTNVQTVNVIGHLQALQRDEAALNKTQQLNVLQYCDGVEKMLAAHVQFEQAVFKNIAEVVTVFVFSLVLFVLIQIAIIFVGRKSDAAGRGPG